MKQKLSSEGYIVLSVEKTEIDAKNVFVFEGKKPDKSFIEGKIGADDIFTAYEMLTKQYNYIITKLFPSFITDPKEQEKVFQELLLTFDDRKPQAIKAVVDTTGKELQKNKEIIESLRKVVTEESLPNGESILADLKKLELTNNIATIHQSLKDITKDLVDKNRGNKSSFKKLKTIATDLGVFVAPNLYFTVLDRIQSLFTFFGPLVHPEDAPVSTLSNTVSKDSTEEYLLVQNNTHINTLIRKRYQEVSWLQLSDKKSKQSYFYSLYRGKGFLYHFVRMVLQMGKIIHTSLIFVMLGILVLFFTYNGADLFVLHGTLIIFLFLTFLSLVIPGETV